jgi:hypothetical protein
VTRTEDVVRTINCNKDLIIEIRGPGEASDGEGEERDPTEDKNDSALVKDNNSKKAGK